MRRKEYIHILFKTPLYIFLVMVALFQIFPLAIMVINSLRSDSDIKLSPLGLPKSLSGNKAWMDGDDLPPDYDGTGKM